MDIYDFAENKKLSLRQVMDFTNCINPLGPSSKAKNSLKKHIKDLDISPDKKTRYLTSLICKKEGIDRDNIVFGQGSAHLLHTILQLLKIQSLLILSPTSQGFTEMISGSKTVIKDFPLEEKSGYSMDLTKILTAMKGVNAVIMPYPHDRFGTALATGDLLTLMHEVDKVGKLLILVESYREYTEIYSPVKEALTSKGTIIVRDFSEFYALAGLPIGYVMGPVEMMKNIQQHVFPKELNILAAHAAIASLKDLFYRKRTLNFVSDEKQFFLKTLSSIDGISCLDTLCPFITIKLKNKPENLREMFFRYRIIIDEFLDDRGNHYLRVPIKKHRWNARFLKTLKNALGG